MLSKGQALLFPFPETLLLLLMSHDHLHHHWGQKFHIEHLWEELFHTHKATHSNHVENYFIYSMKNVISLAGKIVLMRMALLFGHDLCKKRIQSDDDDVEAERSD